MSNPESRHPQSARDPRAQAQPGDADGLPANPPLAAAELAAGDAENTVISEGPPRLFPPLNVGAHPSELGKLLEGERLGHFELDQFIGGGGMGAVFRATDTMLNRTVAVKVLSNDQAGDEETARRFRNEAQSAARLDHENIARVYYVGEDRGVHYIVFEYIEGVNMRDLVNQGGPLPLAEAVNYALQISEALHHASQRDVVHRDIKPSNVLIMPEGRAKLVDMGLARLHQVEHTENDLTASGVTLGTFDYISPEQARDPRTADVRSDLYSLGCTMYFMLTGRPPFPEGTVLQKLLQHQGDDPPDPRDFRPEVPPELAETVRILLSKSPARRYQQPAELIADLLALCDQYGWRAAVEGSTMKFAWGDADWAALGRYPESLAVRHLPWLIPVVLLIAIVAVLHLVWTGAESATLPPLMRNTPVEMRDPENPRLTGEPSPNQSPRQNPAKTESVNSPADRSPAVPAAEGLRVLRSPLTSGELGTDSNAPEAPLPSVIGNTFPSRVEGSSPDSPRKSAPGVGNASTVNDRTTVPSAAGAVPGEPSIFVVTVDGTARPFASLHEACRSAEDGEAIELRFHGQHVLQHPIRIDKSLTIRAGQGYHPQIVFQPATDLGNWIQHPRSMITVAGDAFTLIGVQLELKVPRPAAYGWWSLLESHGAASLNLKRCGLTIRNAAGAARASFLDVQPHPAAAALPHDSDAQAMPASIRLENCIARGQAAFLRSGQGQSVRLGWRNGLLAIDERLAVIENHLLGFRDQGDISIDLQYLTAVVRRGLLLITSGEEAVQLPVVKLKCSDSILMAAADAPLIEYDGFHSPTEVRATFTWSGKRNFYEAFRTFWQIGGEGFESDVERMELVEWTSYWNASRPDGEERGGRQGAVKWRRLPGDDLPLDAHTRSDYLLADVAQDNPAPHAADDASEVGLRWTLLPSLPPESPPPSAGPPEVSLPRH